MSAIYVVNLNEFFANGKVNAYNNEKYDVNEKKNFFLIFSFVGKIVRFRVLGEEKIRQSAGGGVHCRSKFPTKSYFQINMSMLDLLNVLKSFLLWRFLQ